MLKGASRALSDHPACTWRGWCGFHGANMSTARQEEAPMVIVVGCIPCLSLDLTTQHTDLRVEASTTQLSKGSPTPEF